MFKKILASFLLSISLLLSSSFVLAADFGSMDKVVDSSGNLVSGASTKIAGDSLNTTKTVPDMVSSIIKIALGLFGTVALIFVIWGGVDWLLSKGDPKKIGVARDRMIAAAVGLAIIAASYAVTDFIIAQISVIAG
ncbi:MAG: hypothetical protein QMB51_03690 [Patescibacteria group bacterium]